MKAKKLSATAFLIFSLLACSDEVTKPNFEGKNEVFVDFDFELIGDCTTPVMEVSLINKSSELATFLWEFGDGTTSTQTNPKKVYLKGGHYLIQLTATHSGEIKSIQKTISIYRNSDGTGPTGSLVANQVDESLEFDFQVTSTNADSVFFSLGDGQWHSPSPGLSFKYTFQALGTYKVYLFMKNQDGYTCDSELINIDPFGG
jgi:PKD repeat protein